MYKMNNFWLLYSHDKLFDISLWTKDTGPEWNEMDGLAAIINSYHWSWKSWYVRMRYHVLWRNPWGVCWTQCSWSGAGWGATAWVPYSELRRSVNLASTEWCLTLMSEQCWVMVLSRQTLRNKGEETLRGTIREIPIQSQEMTCRVGCIVQWDKTVEHIGQLH